MEKQIVLRENIRWVSAGFHRVFHGYVGSVIVAKVFPSEEWRTRGMTVVSILEGRLKEKVKGDDIAQQRAEELLLEFLNSIAQPVKEKD